MVWWWSIAETRRRWVAGAHGQSTRKVATVAGAAGNAVLPVTVHQSVNRFQIAVYPLGVLGCCIG